MVCGFAMLGLVASAGAAPSAVQTAPADDAVVGGDVVLRADFSGAAGEVGSIEFQVCSSSTCATAADVVARGTARNLTNAAPGAAWRVDPPLPANGTFWWRGVPSTSSPTTAVGGPTPTRKLTTSARRVFTDMATTSSGTIVAVGTNGLVLRSSDGVNWAAPATPPPVADWLAATANGTNVWLVGRAGKIAVSTNSGLSFALINSGTGSDLVDVTVRSDGSLVAAVGPNGVVVTSTDGVNFNLGASGVGTDLAAVDASDGGADVFIGTAEGAILRSSTGTSWSYAGALGSAARITGIEARTASDVSVVDELGGHWHSSNTGANWTLRGATAAPGLYALADGASAGVRWLAGSDGVVAFSTDSGATFTSASPGIATIYALEGAPSSDDIAYAAGIGETIWRTADRGVTWSVVHAVPAATTAPSISGSATVGGTLTAGLGVWTGSPTPTTSHTWLRCDSAGANCTDTTVTTSTYSPVAGDLGARFRLEVSATNAAGTAVERSPATAPVAEVPSVTTAPSITGVPRTGQQLAGDVGVWSGTPAPTLTRQWMRCAPVCAAIAGATGSTYTPGAADVGADIQLAVTGSNAGGSRTETSARVGPVDDPPAATTEPSIVGVARRGETLTVTDGAWTGFPAPIVTARQWSRCAVSGAACANIPGATGSTYTLTVADIGSVLRADITASSTAGVATASSQRSAVIAAVNEVPPVPRDLTPEDGAPAGSVRIALSAVFAGTDLAEQGTLAFQVCRDSGCSAASASGASKLLATGERGTWETPTLPTGVTVWWRVAGVDSRGVAGPFSAPRAVQTPALVIGTSGRDVIQGSDERDVIEAGGGDDTVDGGGGDDQLDGGAGNDRVDGGEGLDTIVGGAGNDVLSGCAGDDTMDGGAGNDRVYGCEGNDRLEGGAGVDVVRGETGNDVVRGGPGNDKLSGDAGNDRIVGGAGNDVIVGGDGADTLLGGGGNDSINARGKRNAIAYDRGVVELVQTLFDDVVEYARRKPKKRRSQRDRVVCGPGFDRVKADREDIVARDCEVVNGRQYRRNFVR